MHSHAYMYVHVFFAHNHAALFYYTLGNISPRYRSSLQANFMAYCTCTYSHNWKDKGVTFNIKGRQHTFRGTIIAVPGDSLASQYLGGYIGLASAIRKCRQCMAVMFKGTCTCIPYSL